MKIMIIEDDKTVRNRLVSLLDMYKDYKVVADVDSVEKALECISSATPDIIILDLGLPGLSGEDAIRAIKSVYPSAEIIVFTIMDEDDKVFASLKAGASGYILKDAKQVQIISAIEELRAGGAPMSFTISRKVLKEFRNLHTNNEIKDMVSPLSSREQEILELLYQGNSYKEIADRLFLSTHTVHTHIKNIYHKLQVNSRTQAIYEAIKKKIIKK